MSPTSPNIVMVSIDSLRGDHCGYLGDDRELTPTMDALAADGVAFENAIAPGPQTFSSMPAIFTGQPRPPTLLTEYPQEHEWGRRMAAIDGHLRQHATLPDQLRELGYDTAGVTPNPWTSTASGFDRGFDHFEDFSSEASGERTRKIEAFIPGIAASSRPVGLVLNLLSGTDFFSQWESLYGVIERTREKLSEPYFLWVFILDTHFPFLTSRAHRTEQSLLGGYYSAFRSSEPMRGNGGTMSDRTRESLKRSYRDTVRASDAFLGQLRSDLAADDPVFIVHSDHGESFGEHGNYGHHHRTVYEENVHVPYVVSNADVTADISAPTSLTTVYETTMTIARNGTFAPADAPDSYAITSSECGTKRAVRGPRFKYHHLKDERFLFDIESDPDETVDLSGDYPELCRRFEDQLARFEGNTSEVDEVSRATRELASLGTL